MTSRFYFNLTNGSHFIHDSEGCQLEDINSAVAFANKAIKELRAEASLPSEVWQRWEMEIHKQRRRSGLGGPPGAFAREEVLFALRELSSSRTIQCSRCDDGR